MIRAAFLASAVLFAAPAYAAPPNIIVIMTDDQGCDDPNRPADCLKNMPRVNAKLADGVQFINATVEYSQCAPSRATLFTGQRRANHGVLDNINPPVDGWNAFIRRGTVPMWLQRAGYFTCFVGVKTINQYEGDTAALGFDYYAVIEGREEDQASRYVEPAINVNGVTTVRAGKYSTDELGIEAKRCIREAGARAYLLIVAPAAPHIPALPAPRHEGLGDGLQPPKLPSFNEVDVSDKPSFIAGIEPFSKETESKLDDIYRRRYESLLAVDEMASDLIARAGKHTFAFYTSDNAYLLGDHRIYRGKLYAYERSIRVPLAMWGGTVPRGAQIDAIVSNVDVPATILDLAGAESEREADGRSLIGLLAGEPWRTGVAISATWGAHDETDEGGGSSDCVRTALWSYCAHSNGERELYSLDRDPYQLANKALTPDRQDVATNLHKLAANLRDCSGSNCWFTADPMKTRRR